MKPHINNKSQKSYRTKAEVLVKKVINKIPAKFLEALDEVSLLDFSKKHYPICRYISGDESRPPRIEIYMDNSILGNIPFFSALSLNIYLLLAINQHMEKFLKPHTQDPEVLAINASKVNYSWMDLGLWNPMLAVFKLFHFFTQGKSFRNFVKWWTDKLGR